MYIELQQTPYLNKYRKQNRYHKIQLARGQSDKIKNDWSTQKRNA